MANPKGISAFLFDEFRSAIQDVRQKVVEEGWFGRVVTPAPVVDVGYGEPNVPVETQHSRPSLQELWAPNARPTEVANREFEKAIDLDR